MAALPTDEIMPPDQTDNAYEGKDGESEGGEKEEHPDPGGAKSQVTVKKKPCIFCLDCVCPYEGEKRGDDCYVLTCAKCKHEEVLTTENTGLSHEDLDLYVGDVIMNRFRDILREQEEMKKMDVNDPDYANDKFREVHYAYDRLFEMMKGTINSMHYVLSEFRENYNTEMIKRIARETEELEILRQRTKRTTLELTVTVSGSKETDDLVINPDSYKIPTQVKVNCFQKGKQGVRLADKEVLETILPNSVMDGMPLFSMRLRQYRIRMLNEMARNIEKAERMENEENQSKKKRKRKKRQKYIKYDYSNKENVQNYSKTKINENEKVNGSSNDEDEGIEILDNRCHLMTQTEPVELTTNVLSVFSDITFLEEDDILKENYRKEKAERLRLEEENKKKMLEDSTQGETNSQIDKNIETTVEEQASTHESIPHGIHEIKTEENEYSLKDAEVSSETEVHATDSQEKSFVDKVSSDEKYNNITAEDVTSKDIIKGNSTYSESCDKAEDIHLTTSTDTKESEACSGTEESSSIPSSNLIKQSSQESKSHDGTRKERSNIDSNGNETKTKDQTDGCYLDSNENETKPEDQTDGRNLESNENETKTKDNTDGSDVGEDDEEVEKDEEPHSDDDKSSTISEPGMYIWDRFPYIPDVEAIVSEYGEHVIDKATQTCPRNESYIQVEEAEQERKEREKTHRDEMMCVAKKVMDDFETLDDIGEFTVRKVNNMFTEILHGIGDYRDDLLKERRDKATSKMERAIRRMTEKVDRVKMEVVDELTDAYRDKVVKQYQERTKCDDNQAKLRRFELLVAHYEKTDQGDKLDELLDEITALAEEMGHDVKKYKKKGKPAKPEIRRSNILGPDEKVHDIDIDAIAVKMESEDACAKKEELKEEDMNLEIQEPDFSWHDILHKNACE